ncbi:hypothetical protein CPLU01_11570 [Colletotrichum plurivorum]|uniref:RING-type domain-containing protein n=1 Tax=Colletotrichum plurivorum TaxID=2175906 RepID=A0A8H6K1Q3_9PEZI|nr:hypothetical protein CPLU01_11570 [Colletotrichum plurivorum]
MSPTGTPDAASTTAAQAWEPAKQPSAVAAALCVAFALLTGLILYLLGWKKLLARRRTASEIPHIAADEQVSPHALHDLRDQARSTRLLARLPTRPLTRPPTAKLARSKYDDDDGRFAVPTMCPVCLDDFAAGTLVGRLPCDHVFCSECIELWLMKHAATCPVW